MKTVSSTRICSKIKTVNRPLVMTKVRISRKRLSKRVAMKRL